MLFCINKYFRRSQHQREEKEKSHGKRENMVNKLSPCVEQSPLLGKHSITTSGATRFNFSRTATAIVYPNICFTNHESIPSLQDAFTTFTSAFPSYTQAELPDMIRSVEYRNLRSHIPLDYVGIGLFTHSQTESSDASSSSSSPLPNPIFDICYKPASISSILSYGNRDQTPLEFAIKKRIMDFLTISSEDYTMVCTANTITAFKLIAESYPFDSNKRLLTVYDHETEAITAMTDIARKRGARVRCASFSWPGLRINGVKLRKMVSRRSKKQSGLFVFPLESRISGARYSSLWLKTAQENGWNVVLDASALGSKGMDTLGLSLFRPEFIVCSFYKVFGGNPSGFAGLFIRRGGRPLLESSTNATSIGVVSIVPARSLSQPADDFSSTDSQLARENSKAKEDHAEMLAPFSKPPRWNLKVGDTEISVDNLAEQKFKHEGDIEISSLFEKLAQQKVKDEGNEDISTHQMLKHDEDDAIPTYSNDSLSIVPPMSEHVRTLEIECRGLDHADSMGLLLIRSRLRCISNWLVIALMKLRHPHGDKGHSLVKIYGPRVKFDRAPALSFNIYDWKGEKVEPALVQKLADRSNISLHCGVLHNIEFSDKYREQKDAVVEKGASETACCRITESTGVGISVVSISLGFLANFEDVYGLWAFVAKFLDADFVEKERWRYMALDQRLIEV